MALEYWLRGDIPPGPIKAIVLTDINRVAEILKKHSGATAILLGPSILDIEKLYNEDVIGKFVEIARILNAPIITSVSGVIQKLDSMKFAEHRIEFPLELFRKLSRGVYSYKLLAVTGLRYAYEWLLLNHLKHYNPSINTISLDPYAQPNATWTMPSLPPQIWLKNLAQLIEILKK
uniref:CO dehydrogenase/acetyl-CoA synthase complex subunit epsilon n=1 Tax=Ignisphaera aggregans TaxID=334771 RepID=A0A7C2ZM88_9CREN